MQPADEYGHDGYVPYSAPDTELCIRELFCSALFFHLHIVRSPLYPCTPPRHHARPAGVLKLPSERRVLRHANRPRAPAANVK